MSWDKLIKALHIKSHLLKIVWGATNVFTFENSRSRLCGRSKDLHMIESLTCVNKGQKFKVKDQLERSCVH